MNRRLSKFVGHTFRDIRSDYGAKCFRLRGIDADNELIVAARFQFCFNAPPLVIVWVYCSTKRISHQATDVWKAIKTAVRLVEEYMIRVMSVSSFNDAAAN